MKANNTQGYSEETDESSLGIFGCFYHEVYNWNRPLGLLEEQRANSIVKENF